MRYKRSNLLKFVDFNSDCEYLPLSERIYTLSDFPTKIKGEVVYLITREFRFFDNFALNYAIKKSSDLNLPLKVAYKYPNFETELKQEAFNRNFSYLKKYFEDKKIPFINYKNLDENRISLLIVDFNPFEEKNFLNKKYSVVEIDGHNIIPARYISAKQEYSAMPFRIKVYKNIGYFLKSLSDDVNYDIEAFRVLKDFIDNKLNYYSEFKNDPIKKVTSNLSFYINFGFISSYRIAYEIIKSSASEINKEDFLEELIVRKELADKFCLYCNDYKSLNCISNWAKKTIDEHKSDIRTKLYSLFELEKANTEDVLWNACQRQLMIEGKIEGYLRMYWAKMLLKWTISTDSALKIAIYFNDKYALDAPSANGYVSILWALAGLHDRPFLNRDIFGKIRYMSFDSIKKKFDIEKYIEKYSE